METLSWALFPSRLHPHCNLYRNEHRLQFIQVTFTHRNRDNVLRNSLAKTGSRTPCVECYETEDHRSNFFSRGHTKVVPYQDRIPRIKRDIIPYHRVQATKYLLCRQRTVQTLAEARFWWYSQACLWLCESVDDRPGVYQSELPERVLQTESWRNNRCPYDPLFPSAILLLPRTHHLWYNLCVACGIPRVECGEEERG